MKALLGNAIGAADAAARERFAADVLYYLSQSPRQLPSEYLYDELGSVLFTAICRLPWYSLTRAEARLLAEHARDILAGSLDIIVELGPGNGEKLATVVHAVDSSAHPRAIHLIDVSSSALAETARALSSANGIEISLHQAAYDTGLASFAGARPRTGQVLMLFLGSNIGNFDPPGRSAFLNAMRRALHRGDRLLLGADLIKSESRLLAAYDDPLGVTAAFNRNLLVRINRELLGNFALEHFDHRAVWNPTHARIEMHLVCGRAQAVTIPTVGLAFEIGAGDSIWTESSYKYAPSDVERFLADSGFRVIDQWIDSADLFALTYAEAA